MRRAFFWVLPLSIVVLPVWVLLGRALFGAPLGAGMLLLGLLAPVLALGIGAIAGLTIARKEVRGPRRATWHDLRVVGPWLLAIVALGMLVVDEAGGRSGSALTALVGDGALTASNAVAALLTFAIVIGGVIVAAIQLRMLLRETRSRVEHFLDEVSARPIVASDAVFERPDGPQAGHTIRLERGDAP